MKMFETRKRKDRGEGEEEAAGGGGCSTKRGKAEYIRWDPLRVPFCHIGKVDTVKYTRSKRGAKLNADQIFFDKLVAHAAKYVSESTVLEPNVRNDFESIIKLSKHAFDMDTNSDAYAYAELLAFKFGFEIEGDPVAPPNKEEAERLFANRRLIEEASSYLAKIGRFTRIFYKAIDAEETGFLLSKRLEVFNKVMDSINMRFHIAIDLIDAVLSGKKIFHKFNFRNNVFGTTERYFVASLGLDTEGIDDSDADHVASLDKNLDEANSSILNKEASTRFHFCKNDLLAAARVLLDETRGVKFEDSDSEGEGAEEDDFSDLEEDEEEDDEDEDDE